MPADIGRALSNDLALHDHLFFSLCHLARIARSDKLSKEDMAAIAGKMFSLVEISKLCDVCNTEIDPEKYPYVNSIKMQLLLAGFSFADRGGIIPEFARSANITGPRGELLSQCSVLTVDNGWFDARQIKAIKDYALSMPTHLRFPIAVMCMAHSVSKQNKQISVHQFKAVKAFNVFGTRMGTRASNQFPKDYNETVNIDGFMSVLAHEYAHNVDSKYVHFNKSLNDFKIALLEKAGEDHNNYLRSMFEDGFFAKNKGEFVASLANQYFSSSQDMLRYALEKLKDGNLNQINQFVMMASIYSDAGNSYLYRINEMGTISRIACPVKMRDGLITDMVLDTEKFHFVYGDGVVTEVDGI